MSRTFDANTANFLTVGDKAAIDITGLPITVAAWIKTNSISAEQGIVTKWGSAPADTNQYELELSNTGKVSFGVAQPVVAIVTGNTTVTLGQWQHVVGWQTTTDLFVIAEPPLDRRRTSTVRPRRPGPQGRKSLPGQTSASGPPIWELGPRECVRRLRSHC